MIANENGNKTRGKKKSRRICMLCCEKTDYGLAEHHCGWQQWGSLSKHSLTGMVGMKGGSLLFTKQTKDGYITCLSTPGHLWQVLAVEVPLSSQCDALPPTWLTLLSSRTRLCPNFCRKKCRKTGQRYHPVSLADRR